MKFVIIGGDAAGMSAASKARRNDSKLEITVLEATTDVSYSACGMPYNIAEADRVMDDLVVRRADVFREKQAVDLRLGHFAQTIDRTHKKVLGLAAGKDDFEVHYDKLLIATGARPVRLDIPGTNLPGVHVLKSLEDGRRIKDFLASRKVKTVLIVGTGYIGLEMADAFHARGIKVIMVDILPRLLPWLPPETAELVKQELEGKGIEVHLEVDINAFQPDGTSVRALIDDRELVADMILIAAGIVPNSELAAQAGLDLGPKKSIAVDKFLRTSDRDIYAAGDCADSFHVVTGQRVWIPLALIANRAGWAVADNVTGRHVELTGIVGSAAFKVLDLEVARTGLSFAEARQAGFEPVEASIKSRSRAHAHPGNQTIHVNLIADTKTGKLLGGSIVGKEGAAHRIDSLAVALHAGMRVDQFFQCDMAYAPPFSPVWDPLLTAANQLMKNL
jgi:NADPH-dependent 2,4-dienoyl-CoA reductase/sulfur reductase-like enzyme